MTTTSPLWAMPLDEFLSRTASTDPTPGGGSVAAVSGAFGMGLVLMALEISMKRLEGERFKNAGMRVAEGRRILGALKAMPERDIASFDRYMQALALPKGTPEEKTGRKAALDAARAEATEAPLSAARILVEGLELAGHGMPLAHSHVVSDIGAGAALMGSAAAAVLLNVDINTAGMPESDAKERYALEAERLRATAAGLASRLVEAVRDRIASA